MSAVVNTIRKLVSSLLRHDPQVRVEGELLWESSSADRVELIDGANVVRKTGQLNWNVASVRICVIHEEFITLAFKEYKEEYSKLKKYLEQGKFILVVLDYPACRDYSERRCVRYMNDGDVFWKGLRPCATAVPNIIPPTDDTLNESTDWRTLSHDTCSPDDAVMQHLAADII